MTETGTRTVDNWLSNLAPSTQVVQRNYFKNFMNWVHLNGGKFAEYTPDELVEYQREDKAFDLLDSLIKPYVRQAVGTYNTKNSRYNNIRSFFAHNRAELPKDKQFKIRPELEPIQGTLTPEEIKLAILSSNPMYQAVFMSMFQSAMDQEMLTYWNLNGWNSLHEQIDQDIIKIDLPGRKSAKNIKPFYTFIGGDAVQSIKAWLVLRAQKVEAGKIPRDSTVIFCNQYGKAMTKRTIREYWLNHLRKLGLAPLSTPGKKQPKTGKGLHEMRDVYRSLWSKSPASHVVGEYLMGHKIDTLEYDKSFRDVEFYREEYEKALPYLQLVSSGAAFGRVEKNEVDQLRKQLEEAKQGQNDEMLDLKIQVANLSDALTKVMAKLEENEEK